LQIYGVTSDVNTSDFSDQSGATLKNFSDSADMLNTLTEWGNRLSDTVQVNLDLLADYIAQNGASQSAIRNLSDSVAITKQNISMASSRIKDVDVASESTKLSSLKVIQEAGIAMLSQANLSQQSILRLLEG
jgi:flagellin